MSASEIFKVAKVGDVIRTQSGELFRIDGINANLIEANLLNGSGFMSYYIHHGMPGKFDLNPSHKFTDKESQCERAQ